MVACRLAEFSKVSGGRQIVVADLLNPFSNHIKQIVYLPSDTQLVQSNLRTLAASGHQIHEAEVVILSNSLPERGS